MKKLKTVRFFSVQGIKGDLSTMIFLLLLLSVKVQLNGQARQSDPVTPERILQVPPGFNQVLELAGYLYRSDYKGSELAAARPAPWTAAEAELKKKGISWLRITLNNQQTTPQTAMLYLDQLQDVEIYADAPGDPRRAGTLIPFRQRQTLRGKILEGIGHSAQAKLQLAPGLTDLYLKINYIFEEVHPPLIQLWPMDIWQEQLVPARERYIFFQAVLLGMLIILSLYHFLIYIQKKDLPFLIYALYTFFTALVLMTEMGMAQLYLFSENPVTGRILKESMLFILTVAVLYFLFMKYFIDLKQLSPIMNKLTNWYLLIVVPLGYLMVILYILSPQPIYLDIGRFFPVITLILGLLILIALSRTRDPLALYFVVGSLFLVLGALVNTVFFYLESSGIMAQLPFARNYLTEWGVVTEILIFSLGLGYRLRLQEQQKQYVEELDQLKTKFFTNISHEFRTPLTVIIGNTSLIKGHEKLKSIIHRNSKHLLQLVNQLLDLAKLESGSLKLNEIQADIIHYLRYLTESLYSMADEKEIALTFYTEEKELLMSFDEEKIQHIVYNLLSNAIKFTDKGGKVVFHVRKADQKNQSWLQFKVSDTGIGIRPEALDRIFDRFYQTEAKINIIQEGSGVGLSLTKELVEMMEGQITVSSQPGKGTEFTVLLPIHHRAVLQEPKTQIPEAEVPETTAVPTLTDLSHNPGERPQLLLIEDNPDVRTYIEDLLKKTYQITVAENGQEGIDKALELIPDIIISDVMMPLKDGFEVCQTLKTDERTSHIPIILLTAKATTENRIEGLRGGADAYLTKPFNKEELFVRLEKLVELRKALQARYAAPVPFLQQVQAKSKPKAEPSLDDLFLQKLVKVVRDRLDDPDLAVADLCRAVNLSNMQVNRKLKALTGRTPSRFIRSIRLEKGMELLQTTELTISEIAYDVGFSDPNYFSRSFSEEFGHPPNVIRK